MRFRRPGRGPLRPAVALRAGELAMWARSGARESLVTSPAHTRSHNAATISASLDDGAAARNCAQKLAPRWASTRRNDSCSAEVGDSPGSHAASSSSNWSARYSRTRPSVAPMEPAPVQTSSPAVASSSRSEGR